MLLQVEQLDFPILGPLLTIFCLLSELNAYVSLLILDFCLTSFLQPEVPMSLRDIV
jgi:hypothetical protein